MTRESLRGLSVAFCLHRVRACAANDADATMSWPADNIDALLEHLNGADPQRGFGVYITFDDGYADAVDYVADRAPRFPDVEWSVFVCPHKTEKRYGFRWDASPPLDPDAPFDLDDVMAERDRRQLRQVADRAECRLASCDEVRALQAFANVTVGSHTNAHAVAARMSAAAWREDLSASLQHHELLFGRATDFAFPFGSPGLHFERSHVDDVATHRVVAWSTEPRPFTAQEIRIGAVLPRFPVDGTGRVEDLLAWIFVQATRFRAGLYQPPRYVDDKC